MTPTDLRTLPHEQLVSHVRSLIGGTTPRLHNFKIGPAEIETTETGSSHPPLKENTP